MSASDIAKERADWLLDAIACAMQDRRFLRGNPQYDEDIGMAILLNGEKAINVAIAKHWSSQDVIYVQWSDDGQHIRKWSREPFDGAGAISAVTVEQRS